jgi:preprotein translocase subunit YajC
MISHLTILAQDAAAAPQGAMNPLFMIAMFIPLFYFMVIRPQRRQQKEHAERIAALRSGDKIVTSGGIYGLITNVKERTVIVKIAENVRIEVDKSSVATVLTKPEEPEVVAESETEKA